jgi:hypothetical protein
MLRNDDLIAYLALVLSEAVLIIECAAQTTSVDSIPSARTVASD